MISSSLKYLCYVHILKFDLPKWPYFLIATKLIIWKSTHVLDMIIFANSKHVIVVQFLTWLKMTLHLVASHYKYAKLICVITLTSSNLLAIRISRHNKTYDARNVWVTCGIDYTCNNVIIEYKWLSWVKYCILIR